MCMCMSRHAYTEALGKFLKNMFFMLGIYLLCVLFMCFVLTNALMITQFIKSALNIDLHVQTEFLSTSLTSVYVHEAEPSSCH